MTGREEKYMGNEMERSKSVDKQALQYFVTNARNSPKVLSLGSFCEGFEFRNLLILVG